MAQINNKKNVNIFLTRCKCLRIGYLGLRVAAETENLLEIHSIFNTYVHLSSKK